MEENTNKKSENLCKVCGDKASGKHYGVASCDGCRGFFKRSIRRNLEYICKENGHCIVDVTRRNQCQACRFKKCLHVNMKRDAVQHERAPRSASNHSTNIPHYPIGLGRLRHFQFSTLPLHPSIPLEPSLTFTGHCLQQALVYPSILGNGFSKGTSGFHSIINLQTTPPTFNSENAHSHDVLQLARNRIKENEVSSSEEAVRTETTNKDSFLSEVNTCLELPVLNQLHQATNKRHFQRQGLNVFTGESIFEIATKLLFLAIKWARTIPSFLQLPYREQTSLLEESWNELFVITAAQWNFPIDEVTFISNTSGVSSRQTDLEDDGRKLTNILGRLNSLMMDHTEYACLKALVLFKPDCRGLCDPNHVELLQDQTHVMLQEYCAQKHNHKGRFGKLLLTLPAVQAVNKRGLEEFLFRQTIGDININRLLGDLAKCYHT